MRVLFKMPFVTSQACWGRWCFAIAALAWSVTPALAEEELTMMTLDGRQLDVADVPQPQVRRISGAEGGFNVSVDDFAVLRRTGQRLRVSFSTQGFVLDDEQLVAAARLLDAPSDDPAGNDSRGSKASPRDGRSARADWALVIRHPYVHPPGHNYTPTPRMEFLPQVMVSDEFEGRSGFALVYIGETGRIRQVRLLDETGPARAPVLQAAIAKGVTTQFQDERQHDHVVYMSYEVRNHEVRQVGQSLVTLPMCCGGCTGVCP
jgi:hypothetical protein